MKNQKNLQIAFLVAATLTVLEYSFVQGLFTWLMVTALVVILGAINIIFCLKEKQWINAYSYLIFIIALTMGYMQLV